MGKDKKQAKSLYEVLNVDRSASQQDIKKVYRQLCLKLHPDKNPGDEEAKARFQELQKVYAVLGDPQKRAVYDQTGIADDDLLDSSNDQMFDFFRANPLTPEDLDEFWDSYRGSAEEKQDLFELYKTHKGDMDTVFEWQICSDEQEDAHRFMKMIRQAIDTGELKEHKSFTKWCKTVASRPEPSGDPLKKRSKPKSETGHALAQIRAHRHESMMKFADALEKKYTKPDQNGKKKAKKSVAPPTDEEFEALQAKLFGGSGAGAGKEGGKGKTKGKASKEPSKGKGSKASKRRVVDLDEASDGDEEHESESEVEESEGGSESEEETAPPAKKSKKSGSKKSDEKKKSGGKRKADAAYPAAKKQKVKAGK